MKFSSELSLVPHLDINPLVKAEPDQIERLAFLHCRLCCFFFRHFEREVYVSHNAYRKLPPTQGPCREHRTRKGSGNEVAIRPLPPPPPPAPPTLDPPVSSTPSPVLPAARQKKPTSALTFRSFGTTHGFFANSYRSEINNAFKSAVENFLDDGELTYTWGKRPVSHQTGKQGCLTSPMIGLGGLCS